MAETAILARRRKWAAEKKVALLAEVDAESGRVAMAAQCPRADRKVILKRCAWAEPARRSAFQDCERRCKRPKTAITAASRTASTLLLFASPA